MDQLGNSFSNMVAPLPALDGHRVVPLAFVPACSVPVPHGAAWTR